MANMTNINIMGFNNIQDYIDFRIESYLKHTDYRDINYYIRFVAGHNKNKPEEFFELFTLEDDKDTIKWDMDFCEGEMFIDLNSVYIFEERDIQSVILANIEFQEKACGKISTMI